MHVLITGSRTFSAAGFMREVLDYAHAVDPITFMSLGDAKGADTIAREWAEYNDVPYRLHIADWDTHGKRAGYLRNQDMLDSMLKHNHETTDAASTYCIAWVDKPLGTSRGTKMMVDLVLSQTRWSVKVYRPNGEHQVTTLR